MNKSDTMYKGNYLNDERLGCKTESININITKWKDYNELIYWTGYLKVKYKNSCKSHNILTKAKTKITSVLYISLG